MWWILLLRPRAPTRMLQGEYVVTKDDVMSRRHFADSVPVVVTTTRLTAPCCQRKWISCWLRAATIRQRRRHRNRAAKSRLHGHG